MIYSIAPKYRVEQIHQLYKRIDLNKDGVIRREELIKTIGQGLVNQKSYQGLSEEKARRNIQDLILHLEEREMSVESVMVTADLDVDEHIDGSEFERLMEVVGFEMSEEERKEVFNYIDGNKSGKISFVELEKFLK